MVKWKKVEKIQFYSCRKCRNKHKKIRFEGKKWKKEKRRGVNNRVTDINYNWMGTSNTRYSDAEGCSVSVYRFNKAHVYVSEISLQTLPQKNFVIGKSKIQWQYDASKILHLQFLGNVGLNLILSTSVIRSRWIILTCISLMLLVDKQPEELDHL